MDHQPGVILVQAAIEDMRDLNMAFRADFQEKALPFLDALADVRVVIGQIKALTVANGGDRTARAYGVYAGELSAAVNSLQNQSTNLASNPFAEIDRDALSELVELCAALRNVANTYATAADHARPGLQRKIEDALASADPVIWKLRQGGKPPNKNYVLLANALIERLSAGMTYKQAIYDMQSTDRALYQEYFEHQATMHSKTEFARKVVSRYRGKL